MRQRTPRYPIHLPILHASEGSPSADAGVGWTRDLSEDGMCVELAERFPPPTSLQVRLRTDLGVIELGACVVWAGEARLNGGGVLHGVAFTQVTPDQHQALRDLVVRKGELLPVSVRVPLTLSILYRCKGEAGSFRQAWTGDISRGGLLLHLPQALTPETTLEIMLHTPKGPLATEAAAVWVEPPERRTPGEPIRHGVRFTALDWSGSLSLGLLLAEAA